MGSLTAHLREPGDHGRLAFHPACPVCRDERLAGTLPDDAIVNRRTQAVITAGLLAMSSATPTVALAQEPDFEREGSAPEQVAGGDPAADPDFDPGGESTNLPFEPAPVPVSEAAPDPEGDDGLVELEPASNERAPIADAGDGAASDGASEQQTTATTEVVPAPSAPPPMPTPTPEAAETPRPEPAAVQPPAATTETGPRADGPTSARARTRDHDPKRSNANRPVAPAGSGPVNAAPEPQRVVGEHDASDASTAYVTQQPSAPRSATVSANGDPARPGDRVHVVLAGESLWSIANDVLGGEASVAQVAREVNRLWERNSDRIGTGNPDLLMVGTRLALR